MKPIFWINTALLFLFRSKRNMLALGLMISFAIGTLIFISAIAIGINDTMILNSTGLYSGHITGSHLPSTLAREDLSVAGVSSVLQRFEIDGVIGCDGKTRDIKMIAVHPEDELKETSLWKKIINGRYIEDNQSQVLISEVTARWCDIHVGETLLFRSGSRDYALTVSGIFKTGIDGFDTALAFCPTSIILEDDIAWNAAVFLEPPVHLQFLSSAISGNTVS